MHNLIRTRDCGVSLVRRRCRLRVFTNPTRQTTLVTRVSLPRYGMSLVEAQAALRVFLGNIDCQLEVCSDAPDWDWDFFCQLAYVNHKWPSHVAKPAHQPNPLVQVF